MVQRGIANSLASKATLGFVRLELDDIERQVGVGVSDSGSVALVLPYQPGLEDFRDRYLTFESAASLRDEESGRQFDCSLLQCTYEQYAPEEITAISFVFHALISLCVVDPDPGAAGKRIHALRKLFDNRFAGQVPIDTEIGLIGEILVIAQSQVPGTAIRRWHSLARDSFDFSHDQYRVDVKATRGRDRVHHFSSSQVFPSQHNVNFVSVMVNVVESGLTLGSLYDALLERLDHPEDQVKLTATCIDITGSHPRLINNVQFDQEGSSDSALVFKSSDVPAPILPPDVLSATWRSHLPEARGAPLSDICGLLGE